MWISVSIAHFHVNWINLAAAKTVNTVTEYRLKRGKYKVLAGNKTKCNQIDTKRIQGSETDT